MASSNDNKGTALGSVPILQKLRVLGTRVCQEALVLGRYVSPILAAFTVRAITLQDPERFGLEDPSRQMSPDDERELIKVLLLRVLRKRPILTHH